MDSFADGFEHRRNLRATFLHIFLFQPFHCCQRMSALGETSRCVFPKTLSKLHFEIFKMPAVKVALHTASRRAARVVMVKWVTAVCQAARETSRAAGVLVATQAKAVPDL